MTNVNNINFAENHNSIKSVNEQKATKLHAQKNEDENRKRAYSYMIGATALASVIAIGIAGRNGKLGDKIQKILGGTPKKLLTQKHTPRESAKDALTKLYDKVIEKAKKDGNTKRVDIFEKCKNDIGTLDEKTLYGNLLEALYKDLRLGEYPARDLITKNIENITSKETNLIKVKNQNGWHYRIPVGRKSAKTLERVSINAKADENLIKELDDLFASGRVKGYYKTPDTSLNWLERHDPITIYLDEKATQKTLDEVKAVCEKYVRSKEDVLVGNKFASGMALQKSPDEQDIQAILEQAKNIDDVLEQVLRVQFTDNKSGKLITSAGYMDSAKKLLDLIKM